MNSFTNINIRGVCHQTVPSKTSYIKDLTEPNKQLFSLSETCPSDFNIVLNERHPEQPAPDIVIGSNFNLLLSQIITKPTHMDGNILDLISVNNKQLIHDYSVTPTLQSITHHHLIVVYSIQNQTTIVITTTKTRLPCLLTSSMINLL